MGFFLTEDEAREAERAPKALKPKKTLKLYDPEARGCDNCELKKTWPTLTSPHMSIVGPRNADLLVMGEYPSETDDQQGEPFVGKTGNFMRNLFPRRELERVAYTNSVRCRPPGNKIPSQLEIHACSSLLEEDIADWNFKAILAVGAIPLAKYINPGDASLSRITGVRFPVEIGSKVLWMMPIFHPSLVIKRGEDRAMEYAVFRADIKRFFKEVDRWGKPRIERPEPENVIWVKDLETAKALRAQMQEPIGVDIETSKLRPYERGARLLTASLSDGNVTFAFSVDHPEEQTDWGLEFFLETCAFWRWVAHNAAFELTWALFLGRQLFPDYDVAPFEDSMACARLYFQRETLLALGIVSRIVLGVNIKELTSVDAKNIMAYPLNEVIPYNGVDAWGCKRVWSRLRDDVNDANYDRIIAAIRSVTEMELMGLPIDPEMSQQLKREWQDKAEQHRQKASQLYEVREFERVRQQEFNIGSAEHVGIALVEFGKVTLPKTAGSSKEDAKKDQYSTDDSVLGPLAETNPLIPEVLGYREATKHESTYIDPILAVPDRFPDRKLHPTYTIMHVSTGRLSSVDPNIQNFPKRRHRGLRKQIVAPPGYIFVSCDMGQLEARVYAMLTRDDALCNSIIKGEDIHTYWLERALEIYPEYLVRLADRTNETDEKKIRKGGRDVIKSDFVFATFFGSTAESCADRTGIPLRLTKDLVGGFWERYPQAKKWVQQQRNIYNETAAISTLSKRVRYGAFDGNESINCVDFETEALTQRGWLRGEQIEAGDVLLTLNPKTQLLEWQSATDVRKFPNYEGPVYKFEGKSFSAVTTPEHRWPFFHDSDASGPFGERTSETMPKWGTIPRIKPYNGPKHEIFTDDWVRLVGWVLTDGSYSNKCDVLPPWKLDEFEYHATGQGVTVCQSKPENIIIIDALFKRLGLKVRTKKPKNRGEEVFWWFSGTAGQWLTTNFPDRILNPDFLLKLPIRQLNILFDTMVQGDGWYDNGRANFCAGTKRKKQIDNFQMLSILCGKLVNVRHENSSEKNYPSQNKQYESMDNIPKSSSSWQAYEARRKNVSVGWLKREVVTEKRGMWCPMVPNTFFVARRNGKAYITGNTPIQGTAADIVIDCQNDLSRIARETGDWNLHPRINIHDDLTMIVPDTDDEIERYIKTIGQVMTKVRYPWQIVPLSVEAKVGYNWAEFEEVAVIVGDYNR